LAIGAGADAINSNDGFGIEKTFYRSGTADCAALQDFSFPKSWRLLPSATREADLSFARGGRLFFSELGAVKGRFIPQSRYG